MIDIKKLTKDDVGKWVKYTDFSKTELGRIKSWNDKFIFVVYSCACNWNNFKDYTAAATSPEDLEFCIPTETIMSEILYEGQDYEGGNEDED